MLEKPRLIDLGGLKKLKVARRGELPGAVIVSDVELDMLLACLNEAKTDEQKRVLDVLEQMLSLARIEPPSETIHGPLMIGGRPNPALEKTEPEKYWLQMEIERRRTDLNNALSQYRFTPFVLTGAHANQLKVIWHRDWRSEIELNKPPDRLIEGQNLELILNLARSRCLDRLRRCAHCKKWLYARVSHQNFCSLKCQQKTNMQREDKKERRRIYMRERYQLLKTRQAKVKPKA